MIRFQLKRNRLRRGIEPPERRRRGWKQSRCLIRHRRGTGRSNRNRSQSSIGTVPETSVLAYEVTAADLIEAPNGRTRIVQRIVVLESGTPEVVAAKLANVARQGLQDYLQAIAAAVSIYRPRDNTVSSFTVGSASVSRDGNGIAPGGDQLLSGPDDGRFQVQVATETEFDKFFFPAD